jgi:hypothetical protein
MRNRISKSFKVLIGRFQPGSQLNKALLQLPVLTKQFLFCLPALVDINKCSARRIIFGNHICVSFSLWM